MKRTDIFLYMTIINVAFGDPVIKKNCSELRKGERYHIATAEILGWSPDSCDQEWSLQNHTVMGYIEKNNTVLSPPMVSLTKQEAELESCVNFTVTLNCVQVVSLTFLVYPPETVEDESVLNPLGIAEVGTVGQGGCRSKFQGECSDASESSQG
ncbi:hypothetical protein Z043_115128 [Scleropages formosus]|uniref:Uncharacterized protein n=1 Tax=Scleropages formosus TaxID=113540 RepID=A0A0P7WS17_SCLFO|nr:hypothetical protein Z043_115128 [Scleropages formosus]